jgi:hypothetical protein
MAGLYPSNIRVPVPATTVFENCSQESIDHFINKHMIYLGGGPYKRYNMCQLLSFFLSVDNELSQDNIKQLMSGIETNPNFWDDDYKRNIMDLEQLGLLKGYTLPGNLCTSVYSEYMIATSKALEFAQTFISSSGLTIMIFESHPNFKKMAPPLAVACQTPLAVSCQIPLIILPRDNDAAYKLPFLLSESDDKDTKLFGGKCERTVSLPIYRDTIRPTTGERLVSFTFSGLNSCALALSDDDFKALAKAVVVLLSSSMEQTMDGPKMPMGHIIRFSIHDHTKLVFDIQN